MVSALNFHCKLCRLTRFSFLTLLAALASLAGGCHTLPQSGVREPRMGDEIVVAGQFFHTGTPVVLWMDPGGYDAYRVERRFAPFDVSGWADSTRDVRALQSPNRYGIREKNITDAELEKIRGGGWDLPLLQKVVDQFVIHFDVCGVSRQCFKVLHDGRDLSVHFMLDIDGTLYQTLDLKERAWHATSSNDRSVGIEIANMGSYANDEPSPLKSWYMHTNGQTILTIPKALGDGGVRTKGFVGHPARPEVIKGNIQGKELTQYDYTPQQYASLVKLTATLCKVFPKIECKYPVDASGKLIPQKLERTELDNYHGVLGHYHIQTNKVDPGPAFNWDYVIDNARKILHHGFSPAADEVSKGHERSGS